MTTAPGERVTRRLHLASIVDCVLTRRRFLQATGAGMLAWPSFLDARAGSHTFHVGIIADTHIIDEFYRGPEGTLRIRNRSSRLETA